MVFCGQQHARRFWLRRAKTNASGKAGHSAFATTHNFHSWYGLVPISRWFSREPMGYLAVAGHGPRIPALARDQRRRRPFALLRKVEPRDVPSVNARTIPHAPPLSQLRRGGSCHLGGEPPAGQVRSHEPAGQSVGQFRPASAFEPPGPAGDRLPGLWHIAAGLTRHAHCGPVRTKSRWWMWPLSLFP